MATGQLSLETRRTTAARRLSVGLAGLLPLALASLSPARPQSLDLAPPRAEISLTAYGFGMFAMEGKFTRFRGALVSPSNDPDHCKVDLTVDAASLFMPEQAVRDEVLSPTFLDATAFPTLAYRGDCAPGSISGLLTMHGQTHPLELSLKRDPDRLIATGQIRRADWGMTERPLMVGPTVRIRVSAPWGQH